MSPVQILLLSFYYEPDLSAGSFRAKALVEALLAHPGAEVHVDVITTLPNRYSTFEPAAATHEHADRVAIHRIGLPRHQSGMRDQAVAFTHFAREAWRHVAGQRYDLVCATSGRLMTATLGAAISRRLRVPLYLDIRDIFVDTITDVLPRLVAVPLRPVLSAVERWTLTRAVHVNLVSPGFKPYFRARYPRQSFSFFPNGIDDEFLSGAPPAAPPDRPAARPLVILYAGNIGESQGLHLIVPELARRLGSRASFRVIGDGGRRAQLEHAIADAAVDNVEIVPPMARRELVDEYRAADVLFLHLNAHGVFGTVLPSKVFEYGALRKPIWAGVTGYTASFVRDEVGAAAVFPPCDADAAIQAFETLQIRDTPRAAFVEKYARRRIMRALAADILSHVK